LVNLFLLIIQYGLLLLPSGSNVICFPFSSVQDQQFTDYKGDKVTLKANPDNVKDFYETGMSYINNVSVAGGGEKADFRLSFTSTNQTGVVPGSDYNKYAFSVNAGMNFTKNFTGRISAQYIRSDSEGRPAQGANDSNLLIPLINGLPRTIDIHDIQKNWVDENGKQITLDPEGKSNNPYWIINKNKFTNNLDRMIGNITLTYKPLSPLVNVYSSSPSANSSTVCLFEANVASRSHLKSRVSTGVNPKVTSTPLLAIFPALILLAK
jgi:hypothetical protein